LNNILDSSVAEPFMEIVECLLPHLSVPRSSPSASSPLRRIDEGDQPSFPWPLARSRRLASLTVQIALVGLAIIALSVTVVGIPAAVNRTIAPRLRASSHHRRRKRDC
jgi:hypothetical protein